jgi:putative flippase GtrA
MANPPLLDRALRLVRGAGVGVLATVADLAVLAILVELVGLPPTVASVPALLVGMAVQFVGCRHVVFRAASGSLHRQLVGFAATEAGTLALNGLAFHLLVTLTPIPYGAARPLGTFLVFIGFSYPLWRLVFRPAPSATP